MERQYLLDISNYQQHLTDFVAVARDGYTGVIVLASDGDWRQPYFAAQLAGARRAGLMVAAYHYQRENVSAQRQIDLIASRVPVDVPVIIDVEHYSGRGVAGVDMTRSIVNGLRAKGYRVPLVYIPRWYWTSPVNAEKGGLGYASLAGLPPLWVSWYPDYLTRPKEQGADQLPDSVWNGYGGLPVALAQYTSSGRVPGYSGPVDQNVFRGTRAQLTTLLFGGETPAEEPDMKLTDEVLLHDHETGQVRKYSLQDAIYGTHRHAKQADMAAQQLLAEAAAIRAQIAAIAADPNVTGEELERVTREVMREQLAGIGTALRAELLPMVAEALGQVQSAENEETARLIAGRLMDRLHRATDPTLPADVSTKNQDGLRGGAAAPEGIGGPTAGDITDNRE